MWEIVDELKIQLEASIYYFQTFLPTSDLLSTAAIPNEIITECLSVVQHKQVAFRSTFSI